MQTTQEHIDGLITTIWNAQQSRSVTNVMVARVLDWLNRRAQELQDNLDAGRKDVEAELEKVREIIRKLTDSLKGVNTLASNAYGMADTNAHAIERLGILLYGVIDYLKTGRFPDDWDGTLELYRIIDEDCGQWEEGRMYYNGIPAECFGIYKLSHVWYEGCRYKCKVTGTQNPPLWDCPDWEFEQGDSLLHLYWTDDNSKVGRIDPKLECMAAALFLNQDVTDSDRIKWDWSRQSWHDGKQDVASDTLWSKNHENLSNSILLTMEDMNFRFGEFPEKLMYVLTATLLDEAGRPMKIGKRVVKNRIGFNV